MSDTRFAMGLSAFQKNADSPTFETSVVAQVVDTNEAGFVEVLYADRNEEVYIKFRLSELISAVMGA